MQYFTGCQGVEEVKARFRELAKKHHPDLGGDTRTMQDIINEYHQVLSVCDGQTTKKDGKEWTYRYSYEKEDEILKKIMEVLKLVVGRNIDVYLIGYWVWVMGDTKPIKESLKGLGFKWSSQRNAWHWQPYKHIKHGRTRGDFAYLAMRYGAQRFQAQDEKSLTPVK